MDTMLRNVKKGKKDKKERTKMKQDGTNIKLTSR